MSKENYFWPIVTIAQVWKEMGWNAILYLAAITAIDPQLYEAAKLDGITRFGKIRYITIPCIMPTIMMLLVLNIGNLLNSTGFDPSYLMGNDMTVNYSENLAVYAYTYGLRMSRYSMSTALSIFNSLFSLALVVGRKPVVPPFGRRRHPVRGRGDAKNLHSAFRRRPRL